MSEQKKLAAHMRAAIQEGNVSLVMAILKDHSDLLYMLTPFGTWLHVAASMGQLNIVEYLISLGIDKNGKGGTFGGNALNSAASSGKINVVNYLLSIDTEMDISEPEKNPLFGAIHEGNLEIVKLLLAKGIDFQASYTGDYMRNMDAVAYALERGQQEIAEYIKGLKRN